MLNFLFLLLMIFWGTYTHAQEEVEEVLVTGIRSSEAEMPGVTLKKNGDFLLLEVDVINDTRDQSKRESELYSTLKNAIDLASKDSKIELSTIKDGMVVPLTNSNYRIGLQKGSRPDTSYVEIRLKTKIPKNTKNPVKLVKKLREFSKKVKLVGRTEFNALYDVEVSILSPKSYRKKIVKLIVDDIKTVTSSLGEDYRVILSNIDMPVEWARSGSIQLELYIPYRYTVVPQSINSYYEME